MNSRKLRPKLLYAFAGCLIVVFLYMFISSFDWTKYSEFLIGNALASQDTSTPVSVVENTMATVVTEVPRNDREILNSDHDISRNDQENNAPFSLDLEKWKAVQEDRRSRLHRECELLGHGKRERLLTQRDTPARHILVNDKYKLMYCFVPKVASSNWRKVFMVLEGQYDTVEEITGPKIDYYHLPLLSSYSQKEMNRRLESYHSFIVVRHPLERLISAWHNKFEEGLYYKQAMVKSVVQYTRFNGTDPGKVDIKEIWFSEFLRYLTQSKDPGTEDEHWNTYMKLCEPCTVNYTYIAFADNMIHEAFMILNVTGAGAVVNFPQTKVSAKHKSLSVEQIISQWRSVPDNLFNATLDRYLSDIRLFGFTMPSSVEDYFTMLT